MSAEGTQTSSAESSESNSTGGESETSQSEESGTQGESETAEESESETGEEPEGDWYEELALGTELGAVMSVWGSAPDEVYAVGGQPDPEQATILHYDGEQWDELEAPLDTPMLNWVYGVDGRVWSVGRGGTIVVHTPGSGVWSAEPSPTDRVLWGVWGASADELWAVGGNGVSDDPVLLRRDGESESWSQQQLPDLGNSRGLFKVWGTSAEDVWAVADRGATMHWDGNSWTSIPTGGGVDLISVWGSDSEGVVAVGGRSDARVARLDGGQWTEEVLPLPGLNGIWIDPSGGATAIGNGGNILALEAGGFDYDLEPTPTSLVLHAVFGFSGGPRFAVGGSLLTQPPHVGVILRHD